MHQEACSLQLCEAWSSPRSGAMEVSDTVSGAALRRWCDVAALRGVGA